MPGIMLALTVCIALVSAASASSTTSACKRNGEFVPNPSDVCSYFRCDFGDEPWVDEKGNIKFIEVPKKCPYGTSTNVDEFDPDNPCGEFSDECGAPPKST